MTLSYISFPLMFLLMLCAKSIFVLLYSDRWVDSVPYFQVLCISGIAYCLQGVNNQAIAAVGKSKAMFVWTIVKRIVGICFVVGGLLFWGINGLLIGAVMNTWFSYFVNIGQVSKYIGYKWYHQLFNILPVALVSVFSAVIAFSVSQLFSLSIYADGAVKLLVYLLVYLGWSFLFKPEAYRYLKSTIFQIIHKER